MKMPGFMVGPKDYRGYAVRICHLASGLRPGLCTESPDVTLCINDINDILCFVVGTSQLQLLRLLWECSNSGSEAKNVSIFTYRTSIISILYILYILL